MPEIVHLLVHFLYLISHPFTINVHLKKIPCYNTPVAIIIPITTHDAVLFGSHLVMIQL